MNRLPLENCRVVAARAADQADELCEQLKGLGAEVLCFPAIEIRAVRPTESCNPAAYDWIVFASTNAVRYFFESLEEDARQAPQLDGVRVAAVGRATAEALRRHGWRVDVIPEAFVAEALVEAVLEAEPAAAGKRFLLPRGNLSRDVAAEALRRAGAEVHERVVYENVRPAVSREMLEAVDAFAPNIVILTSPSTARNFAALMGAARLDALRKTCRFAAIGPVTADAAAELGLKVTIQAREHTVRGLVDALVAGRNSQ